MHTHRMNTYLYIPIYMLDDLYFPVNVENTTNALKLTASVNDMKIPMFVYYMVKRPRSTQTETNCIC